MVSTPETESDETSMGAICAWPCCDEEPSPDCWALAERLAPPDAALHLGELRPGRS